MYIEHYSAYIANATTKKVRKIKIQANTAHEAHKKALIESHAITEEVTKITDAAQQPVYTLKDGFLEHAL